MQRKHLMQPKRKRKERKMWTKGCGMGAKKDREAERKKKKKDQGKIEIGRQWSMRSRVFHFVFLVVVVECYPRLSTRPSST